VSGLSESKSESDSESARQAKALTWEKREEKVWRGGKGLSWGRILSCLVGLRTVTEGDATGADRVRRGRDNETEERAGGDVGSEGN
jgi:hypothetical protein